MTMNNLFNKIIHMAKKTTKTSDEVVEGNNIVVCNQQGGVEATFSNLDEAYAFAGENGFQVTVNAK